MSKHEVKEFPFEVKEVGEDGSFTGILSVYNVVDLGSDLIEPGAFTKTLSESGGEIPCLYRHEDPIGMLQVFDNGAALEVKGKLVLEASSLGHPAVPDAHKALALMRARVVRGMSIGFNTVKSQMVSGVRHLKELSLKEGSVVLFPMLPLAQIIDVKEDTGVEKKMSFDEALANVQTWAARYQLMDALDSSICSTLYDEGIATNDAVAQVAESVQKFGTEITDLIPKLRELMNSTYGMDFKRLDEIERKAGRRISSASRSKIEEAIKQLSALLEEEAAEEDGKGKEAPEPEAKSTPPPEAAPQPDEPDLHSTIENLRKELIWK